MNIPTGWLSPSSDWPSDRPSPLAWRETEAGKQFIFFRAGFYEFEMQGYMSPLFVHRNLDVISDYAEVCRGDSFLRICNKDRTEFLNYLADLADDAIGSLLAGDFTSLDNARYRVATIEALAKEIRLRILDKDRYESTAAVAERVAQEAFRSILGVFVSCHAGDYQAATECLDSIQSTVDVLRGDILTGARRLVGPSEGAA